MYMSCTHVFGILLAAQLAEERPLPTRQEDPANLPTWWHGSSRQFAQKSQSACMQASKHVSHFPVHSAGRSKETGLGGESSDSDAESELSASDSESVA